MTDLLVGCRTHATSGVAGLPRRGARCRRPAGRAGDVDVLSEAVTGARIQPGRADADESAGEIAFAGEIAPRTRAEGGAMHAVVDRDSGDPVGSGSTGPGGRVPGVRGAERP